MTSSTFDPEELRGQYIGTSKILSIPVFNVHTNKWQCIVQTQDRMLVQVELNVQPIPAHAAQA